MDRSIGEDRLERKPPDGFYSTFFHSRESTLRHAGAPWAAAGSPPESRTGSWCASSVPVAAEELPGRQAHQPIAQPLGGTDERRRWEAREQQGHDKGASHDDIGPALSHTGEAPAILMARSRKPFHQTG